MGMFDSIYPEKAFCINCGQDMSGNEFQTKDGACAMASYYSWDAFGETVPDLARFQAYANCQNCHFSLEIMIDNNSSAAMERSARRSDEFAAKWAETTRKCKDQQNIEHPNHSMASEVWGKYFVSNAYCEKCREEGIASGETHPENVFYKAKMEARAKWLEEYPDSCQDCGKRTILAADRASKERLTALGLKVDWPSPLCDADIVNRINTLNGIQKLGENEVL